MSIWDTAKRVGVGFATGGLSEAGGARPALEAASGNSDYVKDLLFGGKATAGIDAKPGHYDAATAQLGQMAAGAPGRAAPQMTAAQLDPSNMNQTRGGLLATAGRLGQIATGQQAGAGELAVNRQVGQAIAAQHSLAMMQRGGNSALAARGAARNAMDIGLAGAGQAAGAQMQDQQAANQQLGSIYGQAYGTDVGVAGQNAQLAQGAAQANMGAQLTQTQMNDAREIMALAQQMGWDQAKINTELAKAGIAANDKGILPGLLQGAGQAAAAYATGGMSAAGGLGGDGGAQNPARLMDTGGLMTPSDARLKHHITDGGNNANVALGSLRPVAYEYRDPRLGQGQQLGLIAQDLERTPGLEHTVIDTPAGKQVHGAKLAAATAAMLPGLDERIRAIEAMTPAGVRAMPGIAEGRRLGAMVPIPGPAPVVDHAALAAQAALDQRRALLARTPPSGPAGYWYSPDTGGWAGRADAGGQ